MSLDNFQNKGAWVKVWSGKWSFHSCSQFAQEWTVDNLISGRPAYPCVIYLHHQGISDCWVSVRDKDDLCGRLMAAVSQDAGKIQAIADDLKSRADSVMAFFKDYQGRAIDLAGYDKFWQEISAYYLPHLSVKYIVDYLSPKELEKYLPILEEARLYAEPVFRDQENFMEEIAAQIAKQENISPEMILATNKEELRSYYSSHKLPEQEILQKRWRSSAQVCELGKIEIFVGDAVAAVEKIVLPQADSREVKGQVAYAGKAAGVARVVGDPLKYDGPFDEGDILITGMTRPEFLPLMKKAAAFLTDAGGILSHAAIVAREMKKPCLIGTQIATQVFKSGDRVEVDAEKGVARRLDN